MYVHEKALLFMKINYSDIMEILFVK